MVKGKNLEVTEQIRQYAVDKFSKLERHLNDDARVEIELTVERNPSIADSHVAEATVWTRGPVLRARESTTDMHASIDQLLDKMTRRITRARGKHSAKVARRHFEHSGRSQDEVAPSIVKTKRFPVKPMTPEEAVLQLELIEHDFFVFQNAESGDVNVVYRRRDADFGLIEPEAS
jgi:putative sigma-54 modulation protein